VAAGPGCSLAVVHPKLTTHGRQQMMSQDTKILEVLDTCLPTGCRITLTLKVRILVGVLLLPLLLLLLLLLLLERFYRPDAIPVTVSEW